MSGDICPHLGVEEDPQTAVAFPSVRNRCFRASKPGSPSIHHQADYCLCSEYTRCPIFLGQINPAETGKQSPATAAHKAHVDNNTTPVAKSSPSNAHAGNRTPPQQTTLKHKPGIPRSRKRDFSILALLGAGLLVVWVIVLGILPLNGNAFGLPPTQTTLLTSTATFVQPAVVSTSTDNSPTITLTRQLTATRLKNTVTVKPTQTKTKKATQTATLTYTPIPQQPTISCGAPPGWVLYVVRVGDTLSSLSRIFNVSIQQLQLANCMGSDTTLYAGRSIYVPYLPPSTAQPTATWTATREPTRAPTRTATNPPPPPSATPVPPTIPPPSPTPEPPPPTVTPEIPTPEPDPTPEP